MDERRREELRQLLAVIGESVQAVTKKGRRSNAYIQ